MIEIRQQRPSHELEEHIYENLRRYGNQKIGFDEKFDSVAFIAHRDGALAGAATVYSFWGSLYVESIYIEENFRKQGIGTLLMEHIETYGRANRYAFIFLETMSFEALGFYQKLGFQLEFTRSGYAKGSSYHYLRKDLTNK